MSNAPRLTTKMKYDDFLLELKKLLNGKAYFKHTDLMKVHSVDNSSIANLRKLGFIKSEGRHEVFDPQGLGDEEIIDRLLKFKAGIMADYNKKQKDKKEELTTVKQAQLNVLGTPVTAPVPPTSLKPLSSLTDKIADIFQIGINYGVPTDKLGAFAKDIIKLQND